jgi:hypothetical protein
VVVKVRMAYSMWTLISGSHRKGGLLFLARLRSPSWTPVSSSAEL